MINERFKLGDLLRLKNKSDGIIYQVMDIPDNTHHLCYIKEYTNPHNNLIPAPFSIFRKLTEDELKELKALEEANKKLDEILK
jgi:hypothetical protein